MERDVGIVGYLTSTPGVGGRIKAAPEDFVVEEISAPPSMSAEGRYTIAQIRVRNWETNRLVRALARVLHISRNRVGFAGTKDKHAVTTRLFSFENVLPEPEHDQPLWILELEDEAALREVARLLELVRRERLGGDVAQLAGDRRHGVVDARDVDACL